MERITRTHLAELCKQINAETGSPAEGYTTDADGKNRAAVGHYHIEIAYGGYGLVRTCTEGGGITEVRGLGGHMPARDLYNRMRAYLEGLRFKA